MSNELNAEHMSLAQGVVETIISIAASEVDGVASVGSFAASGLRSKFQSRPSKAGVEVKANQDGTLNITLHIEVYYGYVLPDLAAELRQSVSDALLVQMGLEVSNIDIYVDGIQFKD